MFGAFVPIFLRPFEEGYKLIGEAYVQGVINGEAVVNLKGGVYEERSFEIV